MNNKIISQQINIIDDILEDIIHELNNNIKRDNPNIPLISVLTDDKNQYETVIIKFISYHINRFNKTNDLQIRLHVINTFYRMHH